MRFRSFGPVTGFVPSSKVDRFVEFLREKRLMGTRCRHCGTQYVPPRADCVKCLSAEMDWVELSGRAKLLTYTKIQVAPSGFSSVAPYFLGIVELLEGGKLLAWIDKEISETDLKIGMELKVVPKINTGLEEERLYYLLEKI